MDIIERLGLISRMCNQLSYTSSRLDKEYIVNSFRKLDDQLSKDIDYVFEILSGIHKLGYTFITLKDDLGVSELIYSNDVSLKDFLKPLYSIENKSQASIYRICKQYAKVANYIAPILNRVYRIGINKSQVAKTIISPMLAKKYEPGKHCTNSSIEYYITEKLDGNRCISIYDYSIDRWKFYSRSGKELKVNFDMKDMPSGLVFDGEILSRQQIENPGQHNFNSLSGAINSKYGDKSDLVYMIFDVVDDVTEYTYRRNTLEFIRSKRNESQSNVKILPVLVRLNSSNINELSEWLEMIESKGGEGLMINLSNRKYEHKRTDSLLKVKSTYTMDMKVIAFEEGTGKNEGLVGSLICSATEGNITYNCKVGSGLSDEDRYSWILHPDQIVGKIIEVAYFSLSQDKNAQGTNTYSLRFPRFKRIRTDKNETSVY